MVLTGLAALLSGSDALSGQLGGPTLPALLALPLAAATVLYALYFLLVYVPTTTRELDRTSEWLEEVLCNGNLKRRFEIDRRDVIGVIGRKADKFVSSIQATVQGNC